MKFLNFLMQLYEDTFCRMPGRILSVSFATLSFASRQKETLSGFDYHFPARAREGIFSWILITASKLWESTRFSTRIMSFFLRFQNLFFFFFFIKILFRTSHRASRKFCPRRPSLSSSRSTKAPPWRIWYPRSLKQTSWLIFRRSTTPSTRSCPLSQTISSTNCHPHQVYLFLGNSQKEVFSGFERLPEDVQQKLKAVHKDRVRNFPFSK